MGGERIGKLLVDRGLLEEPGLERALKLQAESGQRLTTVLVSLGLVAERDLAEMLAEKFGLQVVPPHAYGTGPVVGNAVSPDFLRQVQAVPVADRKGTVEVAIGDPFDNYALDALQLALGRRVEAKVGVISEIEGAIERQYGNGAASLDRLPDGAGRRELDDIRHLRELASEAPIIRVVNRMISRAIKLQASDIHVEPFENFLKIRYRIDGVLREAEAPPSHSAAAVISRIKVLAGLNIAERRRPQDGRIRMRMEGREIDMRVSAVPTMHGESVVLRMLDRDRTPLDFEMLGFRGSARESLDRLLGQPHGIVLVTGPTGSGKTTTLYAALQGFNAPTTKILTVEDPVEYQIEGVNQIPVRPQIGLDFAAALRSILRQDPDVIMVGEMRDLETARIAVQAALTGHKVFSTLHTNDAASSVTRLLDMGVEDYLVCSTVNGVVAQRLVRTLCADCRRPHEAGARIIQELRLDRLMPNAPATLYQPVGCAECDETGYRGRTSIVEVLPVTDRLRQAILKGGDAAGLRRVAQAEGLADMRADGLAKAAAGITTVEEVDRVVWME